MSEYVPTTEEIREYVETGGEPRPWVELDEAERAREKARGEAFDRWLAAHDAEVRASVVSEEPDWEYGVGWRHEWSTRLMGIAHTSRAAAEADVADSNADHAGNLEYFLVRRVPERQAGPWLPAEQEGETDA